MAGAGNNGGDAFVIARHLFGRGCEVEVYGLCGADRLSGDAKIAWGAMEAVGVRLRSLPEMSSLTQVLSGADLVVDGLLGTGADRDLEGTLRDLVEGINASGVRVIALDIPSGLDADSGAVLAAAIKAEHTVTFAHLKRGLLTTLGHEHSGNITVSHIGVPSELPSGSQPYAWLLEESDLRARLSARSRTAHKGSAGRVVLIAGSPGTLGAARLASGAALRAGAGLVTVMTDAETVGQLEGEVVEVMTHPWGDDIGDVKLIDGCGSLVVGPGLGQGAAQKRALALALRSNKARIFDADALRYLAGPGREEGRAADLSLAVFTPHPGEAADLINSSIGAVESDRFGVAQKIADEYGCVVVLKGSRTVVAAPGRAPVVSAFGSPALATAGSGDVLSGVSGALLCGATTQDEVFERAQTAVALHGLAGEAWEETHGDRGLLASEVADGVPAVVQRLLAD
jgi:NAD(P)H-hydrate epimerase